MEGQLAEATCKLGNAIWAGLCIAGHPLCRRREGGTPRTLQYKWELCSRMRYNEGSLGNRLCFWIVKYWYLGIFSGFEMLQATFLAWSLWVVVPISQASEKYAIANMLLSRSIAFAAALALAAIFLAWILMGGSPH